MCGYILVAMSSIVTAQDKLGYVDESYILAQMPEYKEAQTEIEAYQKQIQIELEAKKKVYDEKVAIIKKMDEKTPPSIRESKIKEVTELEKQMRDLGQEAEQQAQARMSKKLQPLTEKIKKSIEAIAQEKGTNYIFRRESLLFQLEENNLSDVIIKKLNLTPPVPKVPVNNRGELKTSNKIAYFSSDYVIPQLPAYKQAEGEVKVFQTQMQKQVEALQKVFGEKYQALDPNLPSVKNMPEAIKKAKMEELEKLQTQIEETKQKANKQAQEKYGKLMEPIYKDLQTKLDETAKEGNYTFVFKLESSLMEPEGTNLSDMVLKKYGVTPKK